MKILGMCECLYNIHGKGFLAMEEWALKESSSVPNLDILQLKPLQHGPQWKALLSNFLSNSATSFFNSVQLLQNIRRVLNAIRPVHYCQNFSLRLEAKLTLNHFFIKRASTASNPSVECSLISQF